jgi:hypothetical protein
MTRDQVHPVAGGRVWTGSQALRGSWSTSWAGDAAVRKARSLADHRLDAGA